MLDLTDILYFKTVAEAGGITRAAEKLFRVQSNVTTRIKKLEDQLGVALFLRENRKMILTADGHRLMSYAERLLALAEETEAALTSAEPGGVFRLGAMESTAAVRLPALLDRLTRAHPEIAVELVTGNPVTLSELVLAGKLDAAFAADPAEDDRLDSIGAFDEQVTLVSTSGTLAEDAPLLVLERGCPHRARLEAWYAEMNRIPSRQIEIGSYHAMFGCVLAGMGVALVPESVIATFPDEARLCRHPLPGDKAVLQTRLFWRKGLASANTRALVALLD